MKDQKRDCDIIIVARIMPQTNKANRNASKVKPAMKPVVISDNDHKSNIETSQK